MTGENADHESEGTPYGAEMRPRLRRLMRTLREHESDDLNTVHRHLKDLWNHPDSFESSELDERWKNDTVLMLVELGVVFGIDYEQAYPEGERDEWPIPVEDRPTMDDDGGASDDG